MSAGQIVLIVFGSLFLLLLLLLFSRVRLRVYLNESGSGLKLSWFFIHKKMKIDDATKLIEGHKKKPRKEEPEETEPKEVRTEKEVPLSFQIERITRLLTRIADRLPGTLTLRARRIVVTVSTDDAAKTALLYGAVSAAMAGLVELIDRSVARVKLRGRDEIDVKADFVGGKTKADVDLILFARVIGALRLLFVFLTTGTGKKKAGHKKKKAASKPAVTTNE